MSKFFGPLAALILSFAFSTPAHALLEARVTYGLLASGPDLKKLYPAETYETPSIVPAYGVGADALVFLPLLDIGVGLRYENLGLKANKDSLDFQSSANRTAILLSYRLINTILHIGPILSYGINHSGEMNVSDGTARYAWKPDSISSYSAGLEVGVGLGPFILGAEAGYQSLKWDKMKDANGNSTANPNTDMSGSYMKAYFGFGI